MSSNSWPDRGAYFKAVGKWPRSACATLAGALIPLSRGLRGALRPPTWRPPHGPPAAWPTPRHPPRGFPAPGARRGPVHLDGRSPPGRAVRVEAQNRFSRVSEDIEVVWWCLVAFWAPFGVPNVPTEPRDQKAIFAKKPVFSWPMGEVG